jgi:translocation and assembly module TamB
VLVKGNADYTNVNGQPPLQSTTLAGTIQSQILQVRTPSLNTDIRDIGANYAFSNGNADLQNLTARLLGGQLKANATIRDVSGKQQGHVVAALRGISLADLKRVANSAGLKPVLISGYVNANSDATWVGNINNVQVKADAIADGKLGSTQNSANGTMPMKAEVHARYNGQTREVALNKSYVRMPHTSLDANGTVSTHSALEVNLLSNDLHELETVADIFSQPGAQPLNLSGQATFNGTVRGSTSEERAGSRQFVPPAAHQRKCRPVAGQPAERRSRTGHESRPHHLQLADRPSQLDAHAKQSVHGEPERLASVGCGTDPRR